MATITATTITTVALTTADVAVSATAPTLNVTGYVQVGEPTSLINRFAPSLTDVGVDGLALNLAGDQLTGVNNPALEALLATAHRDARCATVLLSNFDNARSDFSPAVAARLLDSATNRDGVALQLATFVSTFHWDGVTVDLEALNAADAPGLVDFVATLRRDLPARANLTVDVAAASSPPAFIQQGYDLAALAASAWIVLMAYDLHGPTWSGPGPISPLTWQRRCLTALLKLVPARDVLLGVAGYGYSWPAGSRVHDGTSLSDVAAQRLVAHDHATARFDPSAGEWTARLASGTVLWWSDHRSYLERVAVASAAHLRGLAVWELGTIDSLTRTAALPAR